MNGKTKTAAISLSILLFINILHAALWGAIPQKEREALIALYYSTLGVHWNSEDGWKTGDLAPDGFSAPGTEHQWFGITCDSSNEKVVAISLNLNDLEGTLPAALGDLEHLEILELNSNRIYGEIPPELGKLLRLETLDFSSNFLEGPIPQELGCLSKLKRLKLLSNKLSGPIPAVLGNLADLEEIALYSNQLTGPIPLQFVYFSNLKRLDLSSNLLTGTIPPGLENLSNLVRLNLSSNLLEGSIPPGFKNLSNLERLALSANLLTDSIPPGLENLSNLAWLELHSNQLEGTIPVGFGNLSNLVWLNLSSNLLEGPIPPGLGYLSKMTLLDLSSNHLTGTIPPELANLSRLSSLFLDSNSLSGPIPPGLGTLSGLMYLTLSSNRLTGAIPPELMELSNLLAYGSDFQWNCLYTDDETVRVFLNSKQSGGNWEDTQTIAPRGLSARPASPTSVEVSWNPIAYSDAEGGYRVFYSRTQGGPYEFGASTETKHDYRLEITKLARLTHYYFVVQAWTGPHQNNQNILVGEYSAEVSSGTQDADKIIAGIVTDESGSGLEGVKLKFEPPGQFEITDANGYYEHAVKDGWTGTMTPLKTGYNFTPPVRSFVNVSSHLSAQDFKAALIPVEIRGSVTSGGEGIEGVTIAFTSPGNEIAADTTDNDGRYRIVVSYGDTGTVTLSKGDILFSPSSKDYKPPGVIQDLDNQDYQLSVSISLLASREEDRAVIIRNDYGKIEFSANFIGISPAGVNKFVVFRKENGGSYRSVKAFSVESPYRFTYIDKYLDKGKSYSYIIKALDAAGKIIGESKDKDI